MAAHLTRTGSRFLSLLTFFAHPVTPHYY